MIISTKCVNGTLRVGDTVVSTPTDEYGCLVGNVTAIDILGTPEHETDNESDDIHVDFENDYSDVRIAELEMQFSGLFSNPMHYNEIPLDDVIMESSDLMLFKDITTDKLLWLLKKEVNVATYCYMELIRVMHESGTLYK